MDDYNKALLEAIILQNETIIKLELNILNISATLSSVHISGNKQIDEIIRKNIKTQMDEVNKSLRGLSKELRDINEKYKEDMDENWA